MRGSETRVICPRTLIKLTGGGSAVPPFEAGYASQSPDSSRMEAARGEAGGGEWDPEGEERVQGAVL